MQQSWLRSTALVLLLAAACGDDDTGPEPPEEDASVSDAGKPDAGLDAGGRDASTGDKPDASTDAGPGPAPVDGGLDAGQEDSGTSDAAALDTGTPDTGTPDTGTPDTGTPDAGTPDAGTSDAGTSDAGTSDAGTSDAGPVESFAALFSSIIMPKCTTCHGGAHRAGLFMQDASAAYASLLKMAGADESGPLGSSCDNSPLQRVAPGNPTSSLLIDKLENVLPSCGQHMPPITAPQLSDGEIARIRLWVMQGAPNN